MANVKLRFKHYGDLGAISSPARTKLISMLGFTPVSITDPLYANIVDIVVDDTDAATDEVGTTTEIMLADGWTLIATNPATTLASAASSIAALEDGYDYARAKLATGGTSGAVIYDCSVGNEFRSALTGNITSVTLSNPPAVGKTQTVRVVLVQDSSARTIPTTWTGVDWWVDGNGPVMPTGSGKDLLVVIYMNGNESIGSWIAEP